MTEKMNLDNNLNPLPVLMPTNGSAYEITTSGTSARTGAAITERVIGLYSTEDAFVKIGDNTVVAASDSYDVFIPAGHYREFKIEGGQYVAAIQATAAGTVYINGMI